MPKDNLAIPIDAKFLPKELIKAAERKVFLPSIAPKAMILAVEGLLKRSSQKSHVLEEVKLNYNETSQPAE